MRILIIDDEEDTCWALQKILEVEGHTSTAAMNAEGALALLEGETVDLAFVDAKLPDMEGADLLARINAKCPGLPCVLISGYLYDDDDLVHACQSQGLIRGFIGKPFLLSQVRDVLRWATNAL